MLRTSLFFILTVFLMSCVNRTENKNSKEYSYWVVKHFFKTYEKSRQPASEVTGNESDGHNEDVVVVTEFDGLWMFHDIECEKGKPMKKESQQMLEMFKQNPKMFAQIILNSGKLTMRAIGPNGCELKATGPYKVNGDVLTVGRSQSATKTCPGKAPVKDSFAQAVNKVKIRELPSGEAEFVVEEKGSDICSDYGTAYFVLRKVPMG